MALKPVFIEFGEWLPDDIPWNSQGSPRVKNAVPYPRDSYQQVKDFSVLSTASGSIIRGAIAMKDGDQNVFLYAGNGTQLLQLSNDVFSDVSQTAGYSNGTEDQWEFAVFPGNIVLATNYADDLQFISASGALFQGVGGGAPKARVIGIVNEFAMVGDTSDAVDGTKPSRVRWCGIRDYTTWTVSGATLADFQDLDQTDGPVMGITEAQGRGVIMQEQSISLASYIGPPVVFQFDKITSGTGLYARKAWTTDNGVVYFLSWDGFYALDGARAVPIGEGKINNYFFTDLDVEYKYRITCTSDPLTGLIYWNYPGVGHTSGQPNKQIIFNPRNGRWGNSEIDLEIIFQGTTTGYTLEQLDNISSSLDALPESLDSRAWKGGDIILMAANHDNKLGFLSGDALKAEIDTKEIAPNDHEYARLAGFIPVVDGGSHTGSVIYRRSLAEATTSTGTSAEIASGIINHRVNAPYMRFRTLIADGFNNARGVYAKLVGKGGKR